MREVSGKKEKRKVVTFSRVLSLEEAEREKLKGGSLGNSLKRADREYEERRRTR